MRIEEESGVYIEKIFERATMRGIADYLLFGSGPDEDNRSYEERLEEPYLRFEKAVAKYDKNPNLHIHTGSFTGHFIGKIQHLRCGILIISVSYTHLTLPTTE